MDKMTRTEPVETLVIGAGQAGLAVGYELSRRGLDYVIVDANERIGDAWRKRWDSLRLFTPAKLDGLPGKPFPGYKWAFPSKDEMADYLESYAGEFGIDVQTGLRVTSLSRGPWGYTVVAGERQFEATNVVVAMSSWQKPRKPEFADQVDADVVQLHVSEYANPDQLSEGSVLVVGAGNSGAEVAKELARTHRVILAGPSTGSVPFRPESLMGRLMMPFVGRVVFHRVLKTSTPMGRKARRSMLPTGEPLIRVKSVDLEEAGVERAPRATGVVGGKVKLEDGRVVDVSNVIWCTGFSPDFSWLELDEAKSWDKEPAHERGVVEGAPGLFFVGLKFLYAVSSEQIHGVGRDAGYVAELIGERRGSKNSKENKSPEPSASLT